MSTIGSLVVNLGLASASFSSGLKGAHKDLNKFTSGLKSFATSTTGILTGVAGAFGVALGARAIKSFVGGQMDAIDATAKLSDRLGISTEALVGLQHAAGLAGVSNEELHNSIGKMFKTLDDAGRGLATAKDAFTSLGLDAAALTAAAPEDAFKQIADALVSIENPATRSATAMNIFGRAGANLLPLMMSGSDGIAAAQAEAEKLGLTFSRMDAAQVEAANDAMTRLSAVMTGIGRTLAIELAPFIDAIATKFTNAATSGEGMGSRVVTVFEMMLTGIAKVADWIELLKAGFYGLKTTIAGVFSFAIQITNRAIEGTLSWLELIPGMGDAVAEVRAGMQGMGDGLADVATESAGQMQDAWQRFTDGSNAKAVAATFADIRARAHEAAQAVADAAPKMTAPLAAVADFKFDTTGTKDPFGLQATYKMLVDMKTQADDLRKSLRPPTQVYGDELAKLDGMLKANAITYDTYLQAVAQAQDKLKSDAGFDGKTQKAALKEQRFAFTYRTEKQGNDPVLNINKLQLAEQKKSAKSMAAVERSLASGNVVVASIED